jgi:hypothetical protein
MIQDDVVTVNSSGAIDYAVVSATPQELVLIGFVDDDQNLRVRLFFEGPTYVQMPWIFSSRVLEWQSAAELVNEAPRIPPWELPAQSATPSQTPSLSLDELRDAAQEGSILFTFKSHGSSPAEPPCFVLARGLRVHRRGGG